MKFYVASKFENKKAVQQAIDKLEIWGHTCTYNWTKATEANNESEALKCLGGVRDADIIVALLQRSLKYKGTIGEIGMAIAFNKKVYIVGSFFDNALFVHLDHIEKYNDIDEIVDKIRKDYSIEIEHLTEPTIEVISVEENSMKLQIKTAQGYLCFAPSQDFNPDGTPKPEGKICIEYRPTGGGWQEFEVEGLDFSQICKFIPQTFTCNFTDSPTPPIPPDGGDIPDGGEGYPVVDPATPSLRHPYKCPTNTKFKDTEPSIAFIKMGHQVGYGAEISQETIDYWMTKRMEMLARGPELGMTPPEKYFWERLMGRGAGGSDIATQGPYKGLEHYEGSLTP